MAHASSAERRLFRGALEPAGHARCSARAPPMIVVIARTVAPAIQRRASRRRGSSAARAGREATRAAMPRTATSAPRPASKLRETERDRSARRDDIHPGWLRRQPRRPAGRTRNVRARRRSGTRLAVPAARDDHSPRRDRRHVHGHSRPERPLHAIPADRPVSRDRPQPADRIRARDLRRDC